MAQFTIYRSSDGSAPVLDGTVGSLVALLDACLVTGYGAKAAAGWTKPFVGTNKAVFRSGAGTQFYLRVDDNASVTAKEARITGYETMTDVDTGTGPFPTAAQVAGFGFGSAYLVCRKSASADVTPRTWRLFADSRTAYLFVNPGDLASVLTGFAFGDFYSFKSDDAFNCLIIGRNLENNTVSAGDSWGNLAISLSATSAGHYMARGHTQLGGSVLFGKHAEAAKGGGNGYLVGVVPFTNPEDGGIYLSSLWIHDPTTIPVNGCRGRMRGFYGLLHAGASVPNGDTFSGSAIGELTGKTFESIYELINSATSGGTGLVETSNTLETN